MVVASPPPHDAYGGSMGPRWEYTIVDVSRLNKDVDALNRLGSDGWEAVGMVSTWGAKEWRFVHPVALFKRPLRGSSSSAP